MDEELMVAIDTPITLAIIGSVLGAVFLTISISLVAFRSYATTLDMAVVNAYDSELVDLSFYGKPLPATTLFSTLKKNEALISDISGTGRTRQGAVVNVTSINSLANLFDSKVLVNISKDANGFYKVTVKEG